MSMLPHAEVLLSQRFEGVGQASHPEAGTSDEPNNGSIFLHPRFFTLKVLETLVMRPKYEGPDNLLLEPVSPATDLDTHLQPGDKGGTESRRPTYRLVRVGNTGCFVRNPVVSRRLGTQRHEKVNCHSIIFCMTEMMRSLDPEAVEVTRTTTTYHAMLL